MWITAWSIDSLNEIDRRSRQVINDNGCTHSQGSLPLLSLPTSKRDKGLTEIETLYKTTKIKLPHYITCSIDPHVELARTYQDAKEEKSPRSIIKDARTFATQLGLDITFNAECKKTTVTSSSTVLEANNCQPKSIKSIIKREVVRKYEHEVEQQPWVGHFTVKQWRNEDLDNRWCDISKVWKSIPSVVLQRAHRHPPATLNFFNFFFFYFNIGNFYKQRCIKSRNWKTKKVIWSAGSVTLLMRKLLTSCANAPL